MTKNLFLLFAIVGCSSGSGDSSAQPATGGTSSGTSTGTSALIVTLETSAGPIEIELFADEAPGTVANFLDYVDSGFFDGSDGDGAGTFYRAIPGFVLQGGGVRSDGTSKSTRPAISNEAISSGLSNANRTVAMARTDDPDSATSEFFINLDDNDFLDPGEATPDGYSVFGKVVSGMGAVNDIVGGPTSSEMLNSPVEFTGASRN